MPFILGCAVSKPTSRLPSPPPTSATVENREQAWARAARDQGNKGGVAARAALDMIALKHEFGLLPR